MAVYCESCVFSPNPTEGVPCTMSPANLERAAVIGLYASGDIARLSASEEFVPYSLGSSLPKWEPVGNNIQLPGRGALVTIQAPRTCPRIAQVLVNFISGVDDVAAKVASPSAQERLLELQSCYDLCGLGAGNYPHLMPGHDIPTRMAEQLSFLARLASQKNSSELRDIAYLTGGVERLIQPLEPFFSEAQHQANLPEGVVGRFEVDALGVIVACFSKE